MKSDYEIELERIKTGLSNFELSLFTGMLNLLMKGELEEWYSQSPIGEEIEFDESLISSSEDGNIKELLNLYKLLKKTLVKLG